MLVDGRVAGSTSYDDIDVHHQRLEVGHTWIGRHWWHTRTLPRAALLLMHYAFHELGIGRIAFKTDVNNQRSQRTIQRLGATREGLLRHHMRRPDGSVRDSVIYSLLSTEWPAVKQRLTKITRYDNAPTRT